MPRPQPHPLTLFSFISDNDRARDVLEDAKNRHLVSVIPDVTDPEKPGERVHGINIGFNIGSKSRYTLATLGRSGDIIVEGTNISRIQCSFELQHNMSVIML